MQKNQPADRHRDNSDPDSRLRGPFETASDADADDALDVLTDPLCRRVLGSARTAVTARDVSAATDLSMSATYRKLEVLTDAGLLETQTELREDGYHTTRYRATLDEATIRFGEDDRLHVSLQRTTDDA